MVPCDFTNLMLMSVVYIVRSAGIVSGLVLRLAPLSLLRMVRDLSHSKRHTHIKTYKLGQYEKTKTSHAGAQRQNRKNLWITNLAWSARDTKDPKTNDTPAGAPTSATLVGGPRTWTIGMRPDLVNSGDI